MRRVRIENLKPGMRVAKTVFSPSGHILLNIGVELKERYIRRLRELKIPAIYIMDEEVGELPVSEPVSEETRLKAKNTVRSFSQSLFTRGEGDPGPVKEIVKQLIDEILADPQAIVNLKDIRSYDDYTFAHSVQVTILSVLTGIELNLNQIQLYELGIGALLHDLGKVQIDRRILNKPGRLTEEEYAEVREHPLIGFEALRKNEGISLLSSHVAFQHHERLNGSGYPRGLEGGKIHRYARVAAVADVYDAMTADRVYRQGVASHEAISFLDHERPLQFDSEVVDAFFKHVAVYPVGTEVVLSNGFRGIIVDINRDDTERPIVRILFKPDGDKVRGTEEVDLMNEVELEIAEVEN